MRICLSFTAVITLLYLYFPTLTQILDICLHDDNYSHGILLPFIALYLLYQRKSEIGQSLLINPPLSFWGLLFLTLGLSLLTIATFAQMLFLRWVSFFVSGIGLSGLLFGSRFMYRISPLLTLIFMAKPLPDSLIPRLFGPMQILAAKISALTLKVFHVPVYLNGNIIEIPHMQLLVEEACSGMRSVIALLTVALVVLFLFRLTLPRKLILLASSVAVALLLNVIRVSLTGLLSFFWSPKAASGFFHTFSGMIVFVAGLGFLYVVGMLLQKGVTHLPPQIDKSTPEL